MSWPHFRYQQADLDRLCAPRAIETTEYHLQNQLYGLAELLKQYAGLSAGVPLPWAMEHFISFDNPEPYFADVQTRLPILLAVTPSQADILRNHSAAQVHAIGSAFFYMRELYHRRHPDPWVPERCGTLVFPDKSTTDTDTDFDRDRLACELAALPAEFQPVAVSIFWRDFERGAHRPFQRAGLMLVSSGHPYDPEFLFRQYDLCRQFKYACANDLSTSFCMSVLAGCRFFHLPAGPLSITRNGVRRTYVQEPTLDLPGKQECLAASPFPPRGPAASQWTLAERFAGKAAVRSPDYFQALVAAGNHLLQSAPPPALRFAAPVRLDALAGWLTRGIDVDGGMAQEAFLTVPSHADVVGVRLVMDPLAKRRLLTGHLSVGITITLDGAPVKHCRLWRKQAAIDVPVPHDGCPHVLGLAADHAIRLPDGRRRAVRITALECLRCQDGVAA